MAQNINGSTLETFKMIITNFQIKDKICKSQYFQEIFLITNIKVEVILRMFFLKLNNVNVLFKKKHLYEGLTSPIRPYPLPNKFGLSIKQILLK